MLLQQSQIQQLFYYNKNFKIIANFEEEWQKYKGDKSSIPTAGFGVIGEVAEKDPELVKKFNEEYAKALQWVKENPEEAGKLAKEKIRNGCRSY